MSSGRGLKAVIGTLVAWRRSSTTRAVGLTSCATTSPAMARRRRRRGLREPAGFPRRRFREPWRNAWGRTTCSPAATPTTCSGGPTIPAPMRRAAPDPCIMRAVEKIRKLDFEHGVDATFLPRVELAKRAADLLLSDYSKREAAGIRRPLLRQLRSGQPHVAF